MRLPLETVKVVVEVMTAVTVEVMVMLFVV